MALPTPTLDALARLLGDRVSTAPSQLDLHGRDESSFDPRRPDAVAFPRSTEEVAAVLRACSAAGVPVVPFGAGSSLEGHVLPTRGGVSLDLSGMDAVLEVSPRDLDCRVQAGVRREALERRLGEEGLFFPVDPGADATLGGMAATAASGTMAVRYGTMRENVLGLEVVLADGTVLRTGGRARKSSAGYDLTHLFVGSEGTLGVMTELTLRLQPIPERAVAARCSFPSVGAAVDTATMLVQLGVPLARCELLDALSVRAVNAHAQLSEPEAPTLFLEFQGAPGAVEEEVATAAEVAAEHGGEAFRWSSTTQERLALWRARHNAYFAVRALRPGARAVSTDVCVPVSRLTESIEAAADAAARLPFPATLLGHVGDGNFHCQLMIDPESAAEREAVREFVAGLVARALAVGGTCTGEHGVGLGKRGSLADERGEAGVALMARLKATLDPGGLLNPDKVLPPTAAA